MYFAPRDRRLTQAFDHIDFLRKFCEANYTKKKQNHSLARPFRYLPGKICKIYLQIFLTGKYKKSEKIKDFSACGKDKRASRDGR
jgi:hypothetical protein